MPPLNVAPSLSHVAPTKDPMIERKQRKKLQNRLNQRAHRVRVRDPEKALSKTSVPYSIGRWRLDDLESLSQISQTPDINDIDSNKEDHDRSRPSSWSLIPSLQNKFCKPSMERYGQRLETTALSIRSDPLSPQTLSLMPNHLLHLITYNVFRGFYRNKTVLAQLSKHMILKSGEYEKLDIMKEFPSQTIMIPTGPNIPEHLVPTPLQMEKAHSTWIDLFPFPRIRENLIAREDQFDHWEFLNDVIGDLLNELMWYKKNENIKGSCFNELMRIDNLDDDLTSNRKGLILWGEPFDPRSWEATPGFMAKWGWTTEGCDELTESTNRWRLLRGEAPMPFMKHNVGTASGKK